MSTDETPRVTIRSDPAVLGEIDELVDAGRYPTRSEFFREAARMHLRDRVAPTEVPHVED